MAIRLGNEVGLVSNLGKEVTTLVTGATGLVGNNAVRALVARGERVRALTRKTSSKRPLEGLDVEVAHADVRDADAVAQACQGVDLVIHPAAHVYWGWSGIDTHRAINVTGTRNVCEAALAAGARMVHVSTKDTLGVGDRELEPTLERPPG